MDSILHTASGALGEWFNACWETVGHQPISPLTFSCRFSLREDTLVDKPPRAPLHGSSLYTRVRTGCS